MNRFQLFCPEGYPLVNQSTSYAPLDRIISMANLVAHAFSLTNQPIDMTYKNGEVEFTKSLPERFIFGDRDAKISEIYSDLDIHVQEILICKPRQPVILLEGKGRDLGKRFKINIDVTNEILSTSLYAQLSQGTKIFPKTKRESVIPKTAFYSEHILDASSLGLRYSDPRPAKEDEHYPWLFFSGEFGMTYEKVSDSEINMHVIGSSNLFYHLNTVVERSVTTADHKIVSEGNPMDEGTHPIFSIEYELKKEDLNPIQSNESKALQVDIENPLNAPVVYALHYEGQTEYAVGFPQRLKISTGKVVPASTMYKLIALSMILEDRMFNDAIHDVGSEMAKIPACCRKVQGGYIIDVNLVDNGASLSDDLPDMSEWITGKSVAGRIFADFRVANGAIIYTLNGVDRRLYAADSDSCAVLTSSTMASALIDMTSKPANQITVGSTIFFLASALKSAVDVKNPTFMYWFNDDKTNLLNECKSRNIRDGEYIFVVEKEYTMIDTDTRFDASSVGKYYLMRSKDENGVTHFRIAQIMKEGRLESDSVRVIWDSLGFYDAYNVDPTGPIEVSLRGLVPYRVKYTADQSQLIGYKFGSESRVQVWA
jgi:hypothetical protein